MKVWILSIVGVVVVAVGAFMIVKKVSPVSWGFWGNYNTSSGLALKGYDPVAYFQDEEATSGSSEFTHEWGDATWGDSRWARDLRVVRPKRASRPFARTVRLDHME